MINDRFVIKRKLGEGRSKVFLCTDIDNPGNEYAIKILPENADTNEIKIFRNEFFTLKNLNHPNIITSHEEGTVVKTDEESEISIGSRFIILDYFPGIELLKHDKVKDEQVLILILKQICSVLYYLHQSNYIYYDLKAENILVNEQDDGPLLKIIDMGFACHTSAIDESVSRGTREYIAPEILKKEIHNHQVDLYSLGILLYRIVYEKFPFLSDSELGIYKEHIEREFDFPESKFSANIVEIIKKLLKKDPVERYDNSLQLFRNIGIEIDNETVKYFFPANIFINREEIIFEIDNFIKNKKNKEVILLQGAEGSGKTTLLYKTYSDYKKIILISNLGRNGFDFIKYFIKRIIFSEYIYSTLKEEIISKAELIISGNSEDLLDNLKSIFNWISSESEFTLIFDDFNLYDEFTLEILKEILPVLQVNGINIILSERTDHKSAAEKIINKMKIINLSPFTEENLNEYLDKALSPFFPKDQLKSIIIRYADLLPGNIISFIRDLILLKIIRFTFDGAEIIEEERTKKLLEKSHEEIFRMRFALLAPEEIKIAQFLSCFENPPTVEVIAGFYNYTIQEVNNIFQRLEEKNIFRFSSIENTLSFISDSLKNYTYSTIRNKQSLHFKIADYIKNNSKVYNRNELARQYELGSEYHSAYSVLLEEIEEAQKLTAYSYRKKLLHHLLQLPLPSQYQFELKYELALTHNKLNDSRSALDIVENLLKENKDERIMYELLILKGRSHIELGELPEGKDLLSRLAKKINNEDKKQELMVEIAYAEFDLGNYNIAKNICYEVISDIISSKEKKGRCYNLLGLIDTFLNNNYEGALNNFQNALEMYREAKLKLNVAKVEVNIGNTYDRKGDYTNAQKFWTGALQTNRQIGNLDQEAKLLLNFGIFNYNKASFNEAIEQYLRALDIFTSLRNRYSQGLVLTNLGELYLSMCAYQKAFDSLTEAKKIFSEIPDYEEEAEVVFLLAKLFYNAGDKKSFNQTVNELNSLLMEKDLPERYSHNQKFLELISSLSEINIEINQDTIDSIVSSFKKHNEGGFLAEGLFVLSALLVQKGMYEYIYRMLNENKFEEICKKNSLFMAEKKFLLSIISSAITDINLPPSIKILEEAYALIEDEHITELTWKILFSLGNSYLERGNLKKAKEYLLYSGELINFISNNISDDELRSKYLLKPERDLVLRQIDNLQQIK